MLLWQLFFDAYGADYLNVAITDGMSLIADVVRETVMGAMLPFILRFVATMATSAESSSISGRRVCAYTAVCYRPNARSPP